ncbi:MAG: ATP-binding protein [Desulfatitalea sp.]
MEDFVLRVLEADNPWLLKPDLNAWYQRFLPETYVPRDTRLSPDHRVCLVVGPRQVGKSTLIWKYLSETQKPALFVNCEEPALQQWLNSPALVREDLSRLVDPMVPLFFEEVQQLPEAGLLLKGLVDRRIGVPVFATGSSSFDLESKTRESLAGRAVRHLLLPLSLHEAGCHPELSPLLQTQYYAHIMEKMLCYGGYPTVLSSMEPDKELGGLVEAFIIRDASDRFRIRYPAAFRKVLELVASQIGNLCNYSEWSSIAGISNDTVAEYVHLLQETHILRLIKPFVGGKRAELTSNPKAYFLDNGIRNLIFGGFQPVRGRPDRGVLWENFAFTEIYKRINPLLDTIHYWRSKAKAEVDFIVRHQGRIAACEIKAGDLRGNVPRASRSFIEAYQPELFFCVGDGQHPDLQLEETKVRFIRLDELGQTIHDWVTA